MFYVAITDYGVWNLRSVHNAFQAVGGASRIATDRKDLAKADLLVLPGVGAFSHCMRQLKKVGLTELVIEHSRSNRPLLGICVGMQMLFEQSSEFSLAGGLGLIAGHVSRLKESSSATELVKVPHVGWAPLVQCRPWEGTVLEGLDTRSHYYFVHSYAPAVHSQDIVAAARHGSEEFGAVAARGNTLGCLFHPERSGAAGLEFLRVIMKNLTQGTSVSGRL